VAGEWRKLHNEELHNLYASPNIVREIKTRRMRCARHVARMGRWEMHTKFCSLRLLGRDQSEVLGVAGRIILEWLSGNREGKCALGSSGSG